MVILPIDMLADFVLKTKLAPLSPTRSIPNEPVEDDEPLIILVSVKYNLFIPPVDVFPAQVRSDVKEYLNKMADGGILIGRAQLDYHVTPVVNHHIMMSAGIFEDMFSGYGGEYLYFTPNTNYSFGVDVCKVFKLYFRIE